MENNCIIYLEEQKPHTIFKLIYNHMGKIEEVSVFKAYRSIEEYLCNKIQNDGKIIFNSVDELKHFITHSSNDVQTKNQLSLEDIIYSKNDQQYGFYENPLMLNVYEIKEGIILVNRRCSLPDLEKIFEVLSSCLYYVNDSSNLPSEVQDQVNKLEKIIASISWN